MQINSNAKRAWMNGTLIQDVCIGNPADLFHPDIAQLFDTVVPEDAEPGDTLIDGVLTKPEPPAPAVMAPPQVSPVEFKLLFTSAERIAIKGARDADAVIDDFFDIVDDPRLTRVDLGLDSTRNALAYLEQKGLITEERRLQILTGALQ